jgi:putative SOS response-associated peptidase YedK
MCGRFTQSYTWRELIELYRLTQPAINLRPRYNIAPTTAIDVVRLADMTTPFDGMRLPQVGHRAAPAINLNLRPIRFRGRSQATVSKPQRMSS